MSVLPEKASLAPHQRIGKYQLIRRIAIGGMGEIFLAHEMGIAGMKRLVVVKRLIAELAQHPEQVALFIDEGRIAAQLSHPNIVQVYEFGQDQGTYFLAMEYVPGQDLAGLCEKAARAGIPYPRPMAVHVVSEVLCALEYAHKAKGPAGQPLHIIHRDVSPHNILLSHQGDIKLMDFGIAHAAIRRQRTQSGVLRGKFGYMSPEQMQQTDLDPRTDLFSAGILLWETTLMRRLFCADNQLATIAMVTECNIPRPSSLDTTYPPALEAAVCKALAKNPDDRFQTAAQFRAALRPIIANFPAVEREQIGSLVVQLSPSPESDLTTHAPSLATSTQPVLVRPRTPPKAAVPPKRIRKTYLSFAGLILVGVALTIWGYSGDRRPASQRVTANASASTSTALDTNLDAQANTSPTSHSPYTNNPPAFSPNASAPEKIPVVTSPAKKRPRKVRRSSKKSSNTKPAPSPAHIPSPPPPPANGWLAVASNPYGRVTINGKGYGHTNLYKKFTPGTYTISVKLSDGSGTFSTTTTVRSKMKTKCRVSKQRLTCTVPQAQ